MLKKQKTEKAVAYLCNDWFLDFNISDRSKSNFKKSPKINFLRAELIDYQKIN